MHATPPVRFTGPIPCGSVCAENIVWTVTLITATRAAGEWHLHLGIAAAGARHELRVRVRADSNHTVTAQRVIGAVRTWLAIPAVARPTILDLSR